MAMSLRNADAVTVAGTALADAEGDAESADAEPVESADFAMEGHGGVGRDC